MAVIILNDHTQIMITETHGVKLQRLLAKGTDKQSVIFGRRKIRITDIGEVLLNSEFEKRIHLAPTSTLFQMPLGKVPNGDREKWVELIRRNVKVARDTGSYGTLTHISQLIDPG